MDYNYGQVLKAARERYGLSLQAVADALHLDSRLIEALEVEDHVSLPAPTYVRGYIRAYAQLVRCEPDTLIARYNTQAKSEPDLVASVHSVMAIKQERDARLIWIGTSIAVSILLLIIGGWLLVEHLTGDSVLQNSAPGVAENTGTENTQLPTVVATDLLPAVEPFAGVQDIEADVVTATNPAQTVTAIPDAEAATAPPAKTLAVIPATTEPLPLASGFSAEEKPIVVNSQIGTDRLSLAFRGISWIEVLDANGYRLVYGLFDAQAQAVSVKGQAPFEVIIGDANQVDISINDKAFNSEPYMKRNNTARFRVEPLAGSR